ncbi:MAG TPA: hypothetical protein VJY41_03475 [Prolixibacteraceae bacterium]|nr:hypothetical protein [Prolixibacteraceae bacterium]
MKISGVILLAICCMCVACNHVHKAPAVSFYYWRTVYELSEIEHQTLQENEVNKMYIRYFDVDLDSRGKPRPESPIRFKQKPQNLQIVPVVYIKNKVMLQDSLQLGLMADNITAYINQINLEAGITVFDEIQIDCDWTLKSRDRFMQFVNTIKHRSGKKLSATIRLHQVKHYSSTHIPNVDYATLMYYNMGKIDADTLNSIYDRKIASRYIESLKNYPLKLNIALPIYAWGVHIRDNKVINLVSKIDETAFEKDTNFTISENANLIELKNSSIKNGRYYLRNDQIKIEHITGKELRQMASDIRKRLPYTPDEIIFFDLDETNIKRYNNETRFFKKVAHHF